ncbi:MAG: nucleotide exchange factor GrpE [Anaerolineaceae bacterium]|nr:nucleotide exchange factor GrpE [Anaerolineaceae bacterium]
MVSQEQLREDDAPQATGSPEAGDAEKDARDQEPAADAGDPLAALQAELEDERRRADASTLGWQRERADFSNARKRFERDLLTSRFNAKVDTLRALLPVLDDFERATENLPAVEDGDEELQVWLEGMEAIRRKLLKALADAGVQPLDPLGEPFDPNLHEALGHDSDTDMESGLVSATLQKGYVCGDRVLRPALVRVAG